MDDNNTNKMTTGLNLDEIRAGIDRQKNEASEAFNRLDFNLKPTEAETEPKPGTEPMTETETKLGTETKSEFEFESGAEAQTASDTTLPKVELIMEPELPSAHITREVRASEGQNFVMVPSDPSLSNGEKKEAPPFIEEKKTTSAFNMEANRSKPVSAPTQSSYTPADRSRVIENTPADRSRIIENTPVPTAQKHAKPKKEKKYVTRGTLIACMIITMLLSTLLGSILGGGLGSGKPAGSNSNTENRVERDDSKLSQLNLSDATGGELTVAEIVDKNEDAVVEIIVSGTTQGIWGQMQPTEGAGSGVIVREDGYIATNYHVIQGANKVEVTLHNGEAYSARIVGSDAANDVAVIKIDEKNLTTVEIGDSSQLDVGDMAVAIGNPLGQLGGSVTAGIISALDRTLTVEGTPLTLLQTDAAINGGNSGGGLFNSRGELIGLVESKASAIGVEGLAFALPINSVAQIINDIIESGGNVNGPAVGTPAVGVVISEVSDDQSQYYGLSEAGVYIAQVTGENARRAGFQEGDRIVSFNGREVDSSSKFIALVRKCKVGDTVSIIVSRGGQEIEIKTVLEELQQ